MLTYTSLKEVQHILIIKNFFEQQKIINLNDSYFTIGRNQSNSLVIKSHLISRFHATIFPLKRLFLDDCSYWIIDGNLQEGTRSSNGIFVNNRSVLMYELQPGDLITLPNNVQIIYQKLQREQTESITTLLQEPVLEDFTGWEERPTGVKFQKSLGDLNHPNLLRLASFTELNPFPIIEINTELQVTYANPAALEIFKNIENKKNHPLMQNMLRLWENPDNQIISETVEFIYEKNIFEQHMYKIKKYQVIRSYIINITTRKQVEKMLEYTAFHDELTGLFNRRFLEKKLSELIKSFRYTSKLIAVLFLDLDRFKNINDALGHDFGDLLLQSFALRLQQSLRSDDLVARWGGDEFVIVLQNIINLEKVQETAQRILKNLQKPFQIKTRNFHIKVSIGISIYPQDGDTEEALIKYADAALYRSKESGRAQYKFYTATMTSKAFAYLNLENLLSQALDQEELLLYYQPQINVESQKVAKTEALLRWQQSELGMISPADFIPLAEETGLIIPIGEWVLRTACQQNKIWQLSGFNNLSVSVNISYQQLSQPNFVQMVGRILTETGLEPKYLELEVTESSFIKNINLVNNVLQNLQEMGVNIALDDFGTGYSSLNYLKNFGFDTLKLDKCFMENIVEEDSRDLVIVSTVMILAKKLNLKVVAEGVETKEQLNILLDILENRQVLYVQGYLYSKPLAIVEATKFIKSHNQKATS